MFYGCRCRRHFVSFYLQSMINFTVVLHNAVARKCYFTIQSNTFTVDIDGFQTDWHLICTLNALMLLKEWTMLLSISKLPLNEQRYHLQFYQAHSITTLLLMPGNASIIVPIVENWNAFIIICSILIFMFYYKCDSFCMTFTPCNPCRYIDQSLSYSMITYDTCGLLHFVA